MATFFVWVWIFNGFCFSGFGFFGDGDIAKGELNFGIDWGNRLAIIKR